MFLRQKETTIEATTLFYRQMASLLSAGVSMKDALATLSKENDYQKTEQLVNTMQGNISNGDAPENGLKNYPEFIKKTLGYFIRSDINSNSFPEVLNSIADDNENIEELNKKVKTALIYPVAVLAIALIITGIIMVFVIPTFSEMFRSFGSSLPVPTQFAIDISNFIVNNVTIIALILSVVGTLLIVNKTLWHSILNSLPGIGSLTKNLAIIRFFKHLSLLLSLNAPVNDAIEIAADSVNNAVYSKKLKALSQNASDSKSISDILTGIDFLSPMIIRMIQAGENAGASHTILNEVARYHEKKLGKIEKYVQIFDVAIMVLLGTVIGGLVVSLYLPIFQMAGAVG